MLILNQNFIFGGDNPKPEVSDGILFWLELTMAVSFFRSGEWGVARDLNCAKLRDLNFGEWGVGLGLGVG